MWFRVELNKDQSVKSCSEVETRSNEGRGVFYVDAESREGAIVKALRMSEMYAASARRVHEKRNKRVEKGRCYYCNKPRVTDRVCEYHRMQKNTAYKNRKGKGPRLTLDPVERRERALATKRDWDKKNRLTLQQQIRKRVLREVMQRYLSDPNTFADWLAHQIADIKRDHIEVAQAAE